MVYDDYADIGIFAKWVMDAPGIGERAHPSEGRRCPCTRKGIKLVLLTIIAISQPVFVWTFQIRKRLRISLPQFLEETFQSSEDPMRLRRRFKTGIFGLLYLSAGGCAVFIVKGIARVNSGRSNIKERERLRYESMPYPEFKDQVEAWIPCIVPTRTVSRTATGSLLKDTVYPYVGVDDRGKDLYRRNGKIEPASTLWKDGSGGCKLYDGAYGLMAVFDESMKKSGSWRFDPIYYIDMPNVRQDFIREFTKGLSIDYWPKVQLKGDERRIFLKQGDVLLQDGCAMRYYMYNVSNGVVNSYSKIGEKSVPLQKTGPLSDESFPKQAKWDSSMTVMQEDCLGLCWLKFLSDRVGQFENSPV